MYKSIVFDLGGVMVDFAPRAYLVDRICNEEIEEQVYDLTFGSEEWKQLDAGLVSRFDGNQAMLRNAKAAGREFEVQGVLDDWLHILRPRRRMQELVRRLKNHGYSVYYLSNIPEDVLALLKERGVLDRFDGGVASCEARPPHLSGPAGSIRPEGQRVRVHRRQSGQCAGRIHAGLRGHPDEGERGHPDPQPCHLQCGPALTSMTQNSSCRKCSGRSCFAALGITFSRSSGSSAGSPPAAYRRCTARSL